jgi:TRAP transporter TAXI family solute receptor
MPDQLSRDAVCLLPRAEYAVPQQSRAAAAVGRRSVIAREHGFCLHSGSRLLGRLGSARRFLRGAISAVALAGALTGAQAQGQPTLNSAAANANTIGIISGGADGTYIRIAADLANVLDGEDMRILPIIGRGSLQNLRDIMFLRGIDIGIVQMDAREQLKAENLQSYAVNKLRYIARLYNEEVHVLASRDITDFRQLDGKKVNIDKNGSGTNLTARIIFEKLGIKPQFTTFDQGSSYERLKSGEIQAALYVAGRPVRAIAEFQGEGRFHLLPVPFEGEIAQSYLPSRLTKADYPRLIDEGSPVQTVAVGSILAAYNWPVGTERYRRLERFTRALFARFDEFLQPGRHPKWKEVNLAADTPGWERFKVAEDLLSRPAVVSDRTSEAESFGRFLAGREVARSPAEREALFREFLEWESRRQASGSRPGPER